MAQPPLIAGDGDFLVRIDGLAFDASIGIHAHERATRQAVSVDLAWLVAPGDIARSDDIADTIDYDAVVVCIRRLLASGHFNLLETLTQRIVEALHSGFAMDCLSVTVSKPAAVPAARSVSVTRVVDTRPRP